MVLALKHYTSKIREFSDLESIDSLGFRGEALSSLCALSYLTIITRHKTTQCATKLTYDHDGKIISEVPTAREEGTTVILSKLFSTLPVRKKEFTKNIKREFSKMCQMLYAYCLVCKNIRFSCTNQTGRNVSNVIKTEGANTTRENIISVFGTKQISTLIDIELTRPDDTILNDFEVQLTPNDNIPFSFELIISSVTHGHGRSTTDRQFSYVNSRPCELPKIMKVINEVYRHFNINQYPFVFLNIFMQKDQVDVNVTPDKRQILVAKEKLLLATVKASLIKAFSVFPATVNLQNVGIIKTNCDNSLNESRRGLKRNAPEESMKIKYGSISALFKKRNKFEESAVLAIEKHKNEDNEQIIEPVNGKEIEVCKFKSDSEVINENSLEHSKNRMSLPETISELKNEVKHCVPDEKVKQTNKNIDFLVETTNHKEGIHDTKANSIILLDEKTEKVDRTTTIINVSIEKICETLTKTALAKDNEMAEVKFHSKISPEFNENAEKELQKQISKEMFKKMLIVGQFNHGFIITKLNNDLFIVDQHATDEKYNFEQLQATTVLEHQVLVKYVLIKFLYA